MHEAKRAIRAFCNVLRKSTWHGIWPTSLFFCPLYFLQFSVDGTCFLWSVFEMLKFQILLYWKYFLVSQTPQWLCTSYLATATRCPSCNYFASSPDTTSWPASSQLSNLHPTRQKCFLVSLWMDAACQTTANFLSFASKSGMTSAFPAWILLWGLWEEPCLQTCATSGLDELPEALGAELCWAELPWQGLMFQVPLPWGRSPWRKPTKQQHTSFSARRTVCPRSLG